MQVSVVSTNTLGAVFNTKANSRNSNEYFLETSLNSTDTYSKTVADKQNDVYNSIFEWKNFCHSQIEKGYFDIIA